MGVVLLAIGSRGDAQPMVALAAGLQKAGIKTAVIASADYADLAVGHGVDFVPIEAQVADVMRPGMARAMARTSLGQLMLLRNWAPGMADAVSEAVRSTVQPGDTLLTGLMGAGVGAALAQARGCPLATVLFSAQLPSLHADSYYFAHYYGPSKAYNRFGVRFNWAIATNIGRAITDRVRADVGLPKSGFWQTARHLERYPRIVAASPILVPPAPDWPPDAYQTGYLAPVGRSYQPGSALAEFMMRDPVYVGFGSFTAFSTPREFDLLLDGARRADRPIVTPAPPGVEPGPMGDYAFAIGPVPFEWLFPRVAAVIHHGGAGTTHEGLRAGVPSMAVPFGIDQPYHAARLHQLGVGPAPISVHKISAQRLANLITDLVDGPHSARFRRRAVELGDVLRREDGVAATIRLLDRLGYLR